MAKKAEAHTITAPEEKTTAVAVPETANAIEVVQSLESLLEEDAGAGLTQVGAGDYSIPFLAILQKGSPQVSRANAKYLKGAESGMIMNTVTQELHSGEEGILYVPCGFNKSIVEWKPRDSGGGLVAHHRESDPIIKTCTKNERGQLVVPESGNILVDTAYHFGLLLHGEGFPEFAVISMYSTQLKQSRNWNSSMRAIMRRNSAGKVYNPPTYGYAYRMTTLGQTRDSYDWFGWKIANEGEITDMEIFQIARAFARQIDAGTVKISAPPSDFDESAPGSDIPF